MSASDPVKAALQAMLEGMSRSSRSGPDETGVAHWLGEGIEMGAHAAANPAKSTTVLYGAALARCLEELKEEAPRRSQEGDGGDAGGSGPPPRRDTGAAQALAYSIGALGDAVRHWGDGDAFERVADGLQRALMWAAIAASVSE